MKTPKGFTRWVDLGLPWTAQYAPEIDLFTPAVAELARKRLESADGYLSATQIALVHASAWPEMSALGMDAVAASVDQQMVRIAAEFSGRWLTSAAQADRLTEEPPDHLTWVLPVVGGLGPWLASQGPDGLENLKNWFRVGLRIVGLADGWHDPIADDVSMRAFAAMTQWWTREERNGVLGLDLSGLSQNVVDRILDALSEPGGRGQTVVPFLGCGAIERGPRSIRHDQARRIRELGGIIGLGIGEPWIESPDDLRFQVDVWQMEGGGASGLGLASGFLGAASHPPEFRNAPAVVSWVEANFMPAVARGLLFEAGMRFLVDLARSDSTTPAVQRSDAS